MNKNETMIVVGLASVAALAIGYAVGQHKKLMDISRKIDKSIDEMSDSVDLTIDESIIKSAINKTVNREVQSALKIAAKDEAHKVVSDYRAGLKNTILKKVDEAIDDTDISKIKTQVIECASERAARKVTDGLEYIFDDFRRNMRRMSYN